MATEMLVSREKSRYVQIDDHKVRHGAFMTNLDTWFSDIVQEFIQQAKPKMIIDPFAGKGDILNQVSRKLPKLRYIGYDIDPSYGWPINDSLLGIPKHEESVIVTNPPYLAKYSAKRKGVLISVGKYYNINNRNDLYQVAIDSCIKSSRYTVAIIPETVINSGLVDDEYDSISILEDNPFDETDFPVCVVCIDTSRVLSSEPTRVYKGNELLGSLAEYNSMRLHPRNICTIRFNMPNGQIGLRAVDSSDGVQRIEFYPSKSFDYRSAKVKISSRLMTYVRIDGIQDTDVQRIVDNCNDILERYRAATKDVVLSPFKGNTKNGKRRRRLDYYTARAIIELAVQEAKLDLDKQACLF